MLCSEPQFTPNVEIKILGEVAVMTLGKPIFDESKLAVITNYQIKLQFRPSFPK